MKHEAFVRFTQQTVHDLFILLCAERGNDQGLSFTAGKQSRTMRTGQNTLTNFDRTDSLCVTAVNTRLTV